MAVAITSTVNLVFGSQVMDPVTGILLNDEASLISWLKLSFLIVPSRWMTSRLLVFRTLSDSGPRHVSSLRIHIFSRLSAFSVDNYPEPGKRPLSSTVPTIVENEDGSFYLALGGSGGSKIFPAVVQVLLGISDWDMDSSQAVEWGRVHDQLYPLSVEVDDVLSKEVIDGLIERGHNITGLCFPYSQIWFVHTFCLVADINRVAAVVQAVMRKGDKIYGACLCLKRFRIK